MNTVKKIFNLEKENFTDVQKMVLSIYDDFETQNSWQTYTSLLFDNLSLTQECINTKINLQGINQDNNKNKSTREKNKSII